MAKDNQVLDEITSKEYEHGWTVNLEADEAPKGLNEDIARFISAKKKRARMAIGMAPQGLSPLAKNGGAKMAQRPLPCHQLPRHHLLLSSQEKEGINRPQ